VLQLGKHPETLSTLSTNLLLHGCCVCVLAVAADAEGAHVISQLLPVSPSTRQLQQGLITAGMGVHCLGVILHQHVIMFSSSRRLFWSWYHIKHTAVCPDTVGVPLLHTVGDQDHRVVRAFEWLH
jgi:hypothetical protein